jgi:hypothetical protein
MGFRPFRSWVIMVSAVSACILLSCSACHLLKQGEQDESQVTAYRYTRDLSPGDIITENDLERIELPATIAESIGRLLPEKEVDVLAINRRIYKKVSKGDFATVSHFTVLAYSGLNAQIGRDRVVLMIPLKPERAADKALQVGNHVNILGLLPTEDGKYKACRIMEYVKVLSIQGTPADSKDSGRAAAQISIGVEVKRKNPDVSLQWSNLQTHMQGHAFIEICPASQFPARDVAGVINPELHEFTKIAAGANTEE